MIDFEFRKNRRSESYTLHKQFYIHTSQTYCPIRIKLETRSRHITLLCICQFAVKICVLF
jgi:hypothetical protein